MIIGWLMFIKLIFVFVIFNLIWKWFCGIRVNKGVEIEVNLLFLMEILVMKLVIGVCNLDSVIWLIKFIFLVFSLISFWWMDE